jgi:hypothetical protein
MANNKSTQNITDTTERIEDNAYDKGIMPAETAARIKREGENYKQTPNENVNESTDNQTNANSIRTTDGYTTDKEGLLNNYPVEPEMYYETPGDARVEEIEETVERLEEIQEVNEDKQGKLTQKEDRRGKGTGVI